MTWTSWLIAWVAAGGLRSGHPQFGLWSVFFYIGVFAPAMVGVWLTNRQHRHAGVRALLGRLVKVDVPVRWYVFAFSYMVAIKLTAALIHRVAAGAWPRFGDEPFLLMVGATIASTLLFGQSGEEVGWRGYALPRLAGRFGLAGASVALGILWAAWHLPLFFLPGTDTTGQSFPLYLVQVIGLSVPIAWLYARTNGSLFLTMLMHAAINNTKDIVPSGGQTTANPFVLSTSLPGWITAGLLWVCATYFLVRMHRERLTLSPAASCGLRGGRGVISARID